MSSPCPGLPPPFRKEERPERSPSLPSPSVPSTFDRSSAEGARLSSVDKRRVLLPRRSLRPPEPRPPSLLIEIRESATSPRVEPIGCLFQLRIPYRYKPHRLPPLLSRGEKAFLFRSHRSIAFPIERASRTGRLDGLPSLHSDEQQASTRSWGAHRVKADPRIACALG